MLTNIGIRTRRATGEVRPPRCKWGRIALPGPVMAVGLAIFLRWTQSARDSAFRLGQDRAILASIRGGWATYLGNVG